MDFNPYNRNLISKNDSLPTRQEKINTTKNLIFGDTTSNSSAQNKNNYNYSYNQNNLNKIDNRKDNSILTPQRNQLLNNTTPNKFFKTNSLPNNIRYLIYYPVQIPQTYPLIINQNLTAVNSQQLSSNNKIKNQSYQSITNDLNNYSFFGSESKRKDEERIAQKIEYRDELLKQIEEKKKADEERKRKLKEEEKNEIIKNEEYFKLKKSQADEQARKLREKIARRMQRQQAEELGNTTNIFEISKDFENMNKSRQGSSLVNNIGLTNRQNSIETGNRNTIINNQGNFEKENLYSLINSNMLLEKENYMKEIDNEYEELCQTIKFDIDQMINNNKTDINLEIPNYNEKLSKKEKQYADYILGKTLSPPTPFKLEKNPLSYSYSQKSTVKSQTINLDKFFNKDPNEGYYREKKYKSNNIDIKNKINKRYSEIFENLHECKSYTKKYSNDKNEFSRSESFVSNKTHSSNKENKSNNETKNKFDLASYYNSTISNSMYEKENTKNEIDEDNAFKIEDSSMRTTQNKNKSKTILDKKLINIKENKEDEEDEEDDEENKKLKEEKLDENEEIKEKNTNLNIEAKNNEEIENNNNNLNHEKEEEEEEGEEEEDDNNIEDKGE